MADLSKLRASRRASKWLQSYNVCAHKYLYLALADSPRCHCKAEFCYVCGVQWKNCTCPTADINRIEERAEEIVRRDAPAGILPHERRARFNEVFVGLQDNHECEHSRRSQRIFSGAPRRGFQCEMCYARHYKYILQCRLCYVNVCAAATVFK